MFLASCLRMSLLKLLICQSFLFHDIQRFPSMRVYIDFINNTISRDVNGPVLESFPIVKPLLATMQKRVSKSFQNVESKRVFKRSFHSISFDLISYDGELITFFSLGYTHLSPFSGGCRNKVTDYLSIPFLCSTPVGWLAMQISIF